MRMLALTLLIAPLLTACPPSVSTPEPISLPPVEPGELVEFDQKHTLWTEVLKAGVRGDRFGYAALAKDTSKLDRYLAGMYALKPAELEQWSEAQRYAFWINAYNAHVVQIIVTNYPIDSINDLSGLVGNKVWDLDFIPLTAFHPDGKDEQLSLNDIEHEILRPRFEDARVHAAVNCASIGCPPLLGEAFTAKQLEEQLTSQMRAFLADGDRNRLDRTKDTIHISEIFNWFEDDFERDEKSVRAYVAKYAPGEDNDWILDAKVKYLDYDWNLNDIEQKR